MKYVSIDIETTGLNPKTCQILEFAAVADGKEPFHYYIKHDYLSGDPYALQLNASILVSPEPWIPQDQLLPLFVHWLDSENSKVVAAGKNFGSFDLNFLLADNPEWGKLFNHAYLDPGPLYYDPTIDTKVPNLTTCLERAGLHSTSLHTAIGDALDVQRLLEYKFNER
jgi:DNA polymerase III epsilon subunit-like protein